MPTKRTTPYVVVPCGHCGEPLRLPPYQVRKGFKKRYCSKPCQFADRRVFHADRFWARFERQGDCLVWIGNRLPRGYGLVRTNNKQHYTHRLAWELANGRSVPPGMFVCHRCDNPPCGEPSHLFLGTAVENMMDMVTKGRALSGDRNPSRQHPERLSRGENMPVSRLSDASVIEIRRRYAEDHPTYSSLSKEFGVSGSTIRRVVIRELWTHI